MALLRLKPLSCFSLVNKTLQLHPRLLRHFCSCPEDEASKSISECEVTKEIRFHRDERNQFTQMCFTDTKTPYGPPLAILLPPSNPDQGLMKKCIAFYGEKGFDIVTVNLTTEQFLYPCVAGNAMSVVMELLDYLRETHKHRPYVFHGFSFGIYLYGEVLAQFADHFESHRTLMNNIKCCLWDSPVDFMAVKHQAGRFLYPNSWFKRLKFNHAVRKHFKEHYHDSVNYWIRSRDNFSHPIIKVPNLFLLSYADVLSNPCSVETVVNTLECNGVPVYQKAWWNSEHVKHLEKYCYEYTYSMLMFFTLGNLFPDECGKYKCNAATASLANLRLSKTARDSFC